MTSTIHVAGDSLIVLAGPSGSGKSTWATTWFRASQLVSSDALRGVVGEHEHDLRASTDAFEILDAIVERRLARGLLTVIDTLGMDRARIDRWLAMADDRGRPTHLIRFDEEPATVRKQNRSRPDAVPAKVLTAQLETWAQVRDDVTVGFGAVHAPGAVAIVARSLAGPATGSSSATLRFGLSVSAFNWPDRDENPLAIHERLRSIAVEAEHAGFDSIWVMDHFMQIPQVGREWDPMLEAYTTLSFLAACTTRVGIGALVTCPTHRNLGLLGKTIATLDVLSGGRARCGLGVGWFEREHELFGYEFPSISERYQLLEDALQFLPLQWGPGAPAFSGHHFSTPQALGYPRPIQQSIPILVGGSGENRTLKLVAHYADACNLFGEPETIVDKVAALHRHCDEIGRDPAEITITQLSPVLAAPDANALRARVDELRGNAPAEGFIERATAGTHSEHIDRFARLAEAGVGEVIVSLADVGHDGAVAEFAPVIEALAP